MYNYNTEERIKIKEKIQKETLSATERGKHGFTWYHGKKVLAVIQRIKKMKLYGVLRRQLCFIYYIHVY